MLLVVIPARSGSTGVKRKNVQVVDGEPLVARAARQVRRAADTQRLDVRVVVAARDPQILQVARLAGASTVGRSVASELPDAPVSMAVDEVADTLSWDRGPIVTWQPSTVVDDSDAETFLLACQDARSLVIGVRPLGHLAWWRGSLLADRRWNRQQLTDTPTVEVGLFGRPWQDWEAPPTLVELRSAVDVDDPHDLARARAVVAERRPIVFQAGCSRHGGTGHVLRALSVADELAGRDVLFDPTYLDDWSKSLVERAGYPLGTAPWACLVVDRPNPADIDGLRVTSSAASVVVFEDDGAAAAAADLAVNELIYDGPGLAGPRYAVVRPEFRLARAVVKPSAPQWNVLVSFGGADPSGMTDRAARAISQYDDGTLPVSIDVLAPPLAAGGHPGVANVAERMARADLVVTSAGRTVHEAMAVGVPVVSIPVNGRESARPAPSCVVRLDLAHTLTDDRIGSTVERILADFELRREMATAGLALVDGRGAERVARAVESVADDLH